MAIDIILFILGFAFLIQGATILVDGSASIAKRFHISNLVIGLTIVAFGTSAPELIVSAMASFKGSADIAFGNIIGSNISNTLLILGVAALIYPLMIKRPTVNRQIPFSLFSILLVGILVNDFLFYKADFNILSRVDGLILIFFFAIFIYYTFNTDKTKEGLIESVSPNEIKGYSVILSIVMIIGGLIGLFLGGRWIVNGAVQIAVWFGLSQALIGLTIVAIGTSLPELAASAMAAYRKQADIAIGNVVGSNIFNLLWVLGVSSIIRPINYNFSLNLDMILLLAVTVLLLFLIYIGKKNILGKIEGGVLLILYISYMIFLGWRG